MRIQILGTGCPKCKLLEEHARQAVQELGVRAEIEKVTNIEEIHRFGVMMTPALAIDGSVKAAGRILTKDQIIELLRKEPK
ncbi:MAG: thioredoxin family protein [Spirochaetes bacterium]|nr:thioredoxin family protein [Spirochaetota bacterium]